MIMDIFTAMGKMYPKRQPSHTEMAARMEAAIKKRQAEIQAERKELFIQKCKMEYEKIYPLIPFIFSKLFLANYDTEKGAIYEITPEMAAQYIDIKIDNDCFNSRFLLLFVEFGDITIKKCWQYKNNKGMYRDDFKIYTI